MRIAVNTRLLLKGKLDGIGWFSYQTLRRICQMHPEHEFIFFFDRPWSSDFIFEKNVTPVVIFPPTRHPFLWFIWFEFSVPAALKKCNADFFFSPDGFLSLRTKLPSACIIHDINFYHRPYDLPFFSRIFYNYFFPRYAKKAVRIGTVSHFSKNDISESYGITPEKIDVMYNGAHELFKPADITTQWKTRDLISGGKPYFIFIGSLHPRKNLVNVLKAFDAFSNDFTEDFKLVIVGTKSFLNSEADKLYKTMRYKNDVIFCGRLSAEKLSEALVAAEALIFVPHFEGFGIPMIEAMNCDVPVIASDVTSLPEVAGDAALYADPTDYWDIAMAMERIVTEPELKEDLILKGRIQRQKFSWDTSAEELWKLLESSMKTR